MTESPCSMKKTLTYSPTVSQHGTLPPGPVQLDAEDGRPSPRFNGGHINIMQPGPQVAWPLAGPMAAPSRRGTPEVGAGPEGGATTFAAYEQRANDMDMWRTSGASPLAEASVVRGVVSGAAAPMLPSSSSLANALTPLPESGGRVSRSHGRMLTSTTSTTVAIPAYPVSIEQGAMATSLRGAPTSTVVSTGGPELGGLEPIALAELTSYGVTTTAAGTIGDTQLESSATMNSTTAAVIDFGEVSNSGRWVPPRAAFRPIVARLASAHQRAMGQHVNVSTAASVVGLALTQCHSRRRQGCGHRAIRSSQRHQRSHLCADCTRTCLWDSNGSWRAIRMRRGRTLAWEGIWTTAERGQVARTRVTVSKVTRHSAITKLRVQALQRQSPWREQSTLAPQR